MTIKNKEDWVNKAKPFFEESSVISVVFPKGDLTEASQIEIKTNVFNTDVIIGELPEDLRDVRISVINHSSEQGEYHFHIRYYEPTFNPRFYGGNSVKGIIEYQSQKFENIIDIDVSNAGVSITKSDFKQPQIINSISSILSLYKTYRDENENYVFVYKQRGDKRPESYKALLEEKRKRDICWDLTLDCSHCGEWNSVQYTLDKNSNHDEGFVFLCNECEAKSVPHRDDLWDCIKDGSSFGLIQTKMKQYYNTCIGSS